jgi:hypothetical protein
MALDEADARYWALQVADHLPYSSMGRGQLQCLAERYALQYPAYPVGWWLAVWRDDGWAVDKQPVQAGGAS